MANLDAGVQSARTSVTAAQVGRFIAAVVALALALWLIYEVLGVLLTAFDVQNHLSALSPSLSPAQLETDLNTQDQEDQEIEQFYSLSTAADQQGFAVQLRETAVQISNATQELQDMLPGQYSWPPIPALILAVRDADVPGYDFDDEIIGYANRVASKRGQLALEDSLARSIDAKIGEIKNEVKVFTDQKTAIGWTARYQKDLKASAMQRAVPKESRYTGLEKRKANFPDYADIMGTAVSFRGSFEPDFPWVGGIVFAPHFVLAALLAMMASALGSGLLLAQQRVSGRKSAGGYLTFVFSALLAIASVLAVFAGALTFGALALSAYVFMAAGFAAGFFPDMVVSALQRVLGNALAPQDPKAGRS